MKIKQVFCEGLELSNFTKYSEQDFDFLRGLGNYYYNSYQESAYDILKETFEKGIRNSMLQTLLARESKKYLEGYTNYYSAITEESLSKMGSQLTEDLVGQVWTPSDEKPFVMGSVDFEPLNEWNKKKNTKKWVIAEHVVNNANVLLYFPVVSEYLENVLKEKKIELKLTEKDIFRSVLESINNFNWKKEVVVMADSQMDEGIIKEIFVEGNENE